jgi:hypothetical protein
MKRSSWPRIGALAMALVPLLACAHASLSVLKRCPARPGDYPIFLTEGDIEDPCEAVGTIKTRAYDKWEAEDRGRADLTYYARRLGGDAVIWIKKEPQLRERFGFAPTGTFRAGTTLETTYCYTGTIVRIAREKAPAVSNAP